MKKHCDFVPLAPQSECKKAAGKSWCMVFLLSSVFLSPLHLRATSIVALVDDMEHRLVIAADCRVLRGSGPASDCKIIVEPGCVVAVAGLYQEAGAGFKLRQFVRAACQEPGDLRSKAEAFVRISRKPYERAVRSIREKQPADFAQTVANKPTEVVFAGIQNGRVALMVRGLEADLAGRIRVERYESIAPSYPRTGYFLGLNGHIRAYVRAHPDWVRGDYAAAAHRFVEMEIAAHPDLAGPPISELEIDQYGHVHWLDKGMCNIRESD